MWQREREKIVLHRGMKKKQRWNASSPGPFRKNEFDREEIDHLVIIYMVNQPHLQSVLVT